MTIVADYRRLGERLNAIFNSPKVVSLHFPSPVADETFRDEFGFVFLEDGSVGPFYVSMEGILQTLWERYPGPGEYCSQSARLLRGFTEGDLADRALALGVYNALSASLFRAADFTAPDRSASSGLEDIQAGTTVGMVGYFCPLVDKLVERGCQVLILEKTPERVDLRALVSVTQNALDLRQCSHVLCTAATLINDTVDEILSAVKGYANLEIIGPSGSGLPDMLLERGVSSVGGIRFSDRFHLLELLEQGKSWGAAGQKYQLNAENYPGFSRLIEELGAQ